MKPEINELWPHPLIPLQKRGTVLQYIAKLFVLPHQLRNIAEHYTPKPEDIKRNKREL